jgi:hypothetical protein
MQIAFLVAASIFLVNRNSQLASVNATATPGQETGRRQEYSHEAFIHSRLVSHFAGPPSGPGVSGDPWRNVAGALVSFPYFVSQ